MFQNISENNSEETSSIYSSNDESEMEVDNVVDLCCKSEEIVVSYLITRNARKQFYTWAGQALLAVRPFQSIDTKTEVTF